MSAISTNQYSPFKQSICDFLRERCRREPEFVEKVKNPKKNIDKCLDYIIGDAKREGKWLVENGYACSYRLFPQNKTIKN